MSGKSTIARPDVRIFLRLSEVFGQTKAETDSALRSQRQKLFVSHSAAKAISEDNKFIFIGRKGSGKTAMVYDFEESRKGVYDIVLRIDKDKEPSWLLYNFYYRQFADAAKQIMNPSLTGNAKRRGQANDIQNVFDPVSLLQMAWTASIQICMIDAVVRNNRIFLNGRFSDEREILRNYLRSELDITDDPDTHIADSVNSVLAAVFDLIQQRISNFIDASNTNIGALLARIVRWATSPVTRRIITPDVDKVLRKFLRDSDVRVLVSLDKYDDLVDELITELDDLASLQRRFPGVINSDDDRSFTKDSMLEFQKAMLKGLLLASRNLKEDPDYRNVHFALAIPDDRFIELEMREAARFNTAHVEKIRWTPPELVEFFVRRCAVALQECGVPAEKRFEDVEIHSTEELRDACNKVFSTLGVPTSLAHSRIKERREDLIFYVLRHTLWRPRDVQRYFSAIFKNISLVASQRNINGLEFEEIYRTAVRDTSIEIIRDEFMVEYKSEYPLLPQVLHLFHNRGSTLSESALQEVISSGGVPLSPGEAVKPDEIIERLYRIGFLGIRLSEISGDGRGRFQQQGDKAYLFAYNDEGADRHLVLNGRRKRAVLSERESWVIHPMFYDYLRTQTRQAFIIHDMDWQTVDTQYAVGYRPKGRG